MVLSAQLRAARRTHVQELRRAARRCNVQLVSDTASREKVQEFAGEIQSSSGPQDQKEAAAAAFKAYEATFAEEDGTNPQAQGETGGFRLRGKSFLLTYNWDFTGKAFPDGTAAATTA